MKKNVVINDIAYYEGDYKVFKHGLLYIVKELYFEFDPVWIEDSRWEDVDRANDHCNILMLQNRPSQNKV